MAKEKTPAQKALQAAEALKALNLKKAAEASTGPSAAEKETARLAKEKADEAEIAIAKAKADKDTVDAAKPEPKKGAFVNPFEVGVTYPDFLEAIPKGKTVAQYCKGKISGDQIKDLVNDLKYYKKK